MLNGLISIQENVNEFQIINNLWKLLNTCKREKNFLLDFRPQESNVEFRPDNAIVEVHLSLHWKSPSQKEVLLFCPPSYCTASLSLK